MCVKNNFNRPILPNKKMTQVERKKNAIFVIFEKNENRKI